MTCPKCGAGLEEGATECAFCGVVLARHRERSSDSGASSREAFERYPRPRAMPQEAGDDEPEGWPALLFYAEPKVNPIVLGLRAALLAGLVVWSVGFFRIAMEGGRLASSLMHLVHLPFHEGGHILFMPFGSFLMSLGGSLTQFLVPIVCTVAFLRRRDTFGAAVGLWWAGQSLMDVAPYIADARALQLVLIGGGTGAEVEGHDWEAILLALGLINHDVAIGRAVNALGILLMLLALGWAGYVLAGQHRLRERY